MLESSFPRPLFRLETRHLVDLPLPLEHVPGEDDVGVHHMELLLDLELRQVGTRQGSEPGPVRYQSREGSYLARYQIAPAQYVGQVLPREGLDGVLGGAVVVNNEEGDPRKEGRSIVGG